MKSYDVIIIGTGGGTKISAPLLKLGKKIAVIEKGKAGGTCLNRGCIPSKMFIHPANQIQNLKNLKKLNIDAQLHKLDFEALVAAINAHTDSVSEGIDNKYIREDNADYYKGHARFVNNNTVSVGEYSLTAPKIIIATGSRAKVPAIKGLAHTPFMTSNEALRNRKLPKRLIVLGGGYIAAELGGAYAGFGSEVTFILRSTFLKNEDSEVLSEFKKGFYPGKNIFENSTINQVSYSDRTYFVEIQLSDGTLQTVEADELLVALGITPNSDNLGLENTDIVVKEDGFIAVDEYLQTNVPGVYAIGDVAGNFLFRHSVNFEGEYWIDANYLSSAPYKIDYPPMPSAVFTHPEIASVGCTEEAARKKSLEIVIGRAKYTSCAMAKARGLESGTG
jgi:mycothione reductase